MTDINIIWFSFQFPRGYNFLYLYIYLQYNNIIVLTKYFSQ